ncbi:MAG: glycosyltransferase [Prevotella sp.]|nr:glycosyltransferase [Bacteroides sp.]MCM1366857.1 glycosyltransferase [Prevotella sp.]MCM1437417.1 glycosyltransferase [Prevotella sp.]
MTKIPNNDTSPLISIVTITYCAANVLTPTLESVSAQNFDDYEHIIVDGASPDNTLDVANKLRTPKTKILSEPDNGLYDAMNKGLKTARGKYIIFLNAGDSFSSKNTLSHYAELCQSNADIIYGDTDIVDADRRFIAHRHLSAPKSLSFKSFSSGMLICHQAFMVRKELTPLYDLKYRFSADFDWCIKCIKNADPLKCINLNEVTIHYLNDGLTDHNKLKSLKERFNIMCKHYGYLPTFARHLSFIPRAISRKFNLFK